MKRSGGARVAWGREGLTVLIAVGVAVVSALFAHAFRETAHAVLHVLSGRDDPISAASALGPLPTFAIAIVAAGVAALLGHGAARAWGDRLGLSAVAATARDDAPLPGVRGTLLRSSGTWLASASLVSVGRESAMLETGGVVGALAGTATGHRRAVAAAGVTAAFTAAYHAPLGSVLYVMEHLGVRGRPRGTVCAITGAVVAQLVMRTLFDVSPIFPTPAANPIAAVVLALVVVAPATVASRTVLAARERWAPAARERLPSVARVAVFALLTAATVALVPEVAGNGMDGLRLAAEHPTVSIGVALALGKLVATTGALGAGVPGGAFSPTMATAGGTALLTVLALGGLGIDLPGAAWDAVFPAMVVAVAVGLQAPLTAVVAVPEMAGTYGYIPVAIVVAALAVALHRRLPGAPEAVVHDEDA